MNALKNASVMFVLIGLTLASNSTATKPVSRYMRDIGIIYLEEVETLNPECAENGIDGDCMRRWESKLARIEDRVDIELNDKSLRRSSGDNPYWDLLKTVKYAHKFYVLSDPGTRKIWSHANIICASYAHGVALDGEYVRDGGCDAAIDEATKASNSPR
jgi:hypothetical protein